MRDVPQWIAEQMAETWGPEDYEEHVESIEPDEHEYSLHPDPEVPWPPRECSRVKVHLSDAQIERLTAVAVQKPPPWWLEGVPTPWRVSERGYGTHITESRASRLHAGRPALYRRHRVWLRGALTHISCGRCLRTLPVGEFSRTVRGIHGYCKACNNASRGSRRRRPPTRRTPCRSV